MQADLFNSSLCHHTVVGGIYEFVFNRAASAVKNEDFHVYYI